MGINTENADSGDIKPQPSPDMRSSGATTSNGTNRARRDGNRRLTTTSKKDRFQGSSPELMGYVFTAGQSRASQIHQFTKTDEKIKALVGRKFDPHVLQSLEEGSLTLPDEPEPTLQSDGTISEIEKLKYTRYFEKWLQTCHTVNKEMKQAYAIYLGQCDDDMKSTLAKHPSYESTNRDKDVLSLHRILQSVNFSYTNSEEPIVSMWKAKHDFIRIKQQKGQTVNDYYERFNALKEVNDTLDTQIHDDPGVVEIIAKEQGITLADLGPEELESFTEATMSEGRERMMVIHFLHGAEHDTYSSLIRHLRHNYLMNKRNDYPQTLHAAYILLKGWNRPGRTQSNSTTTSTSNSSRNAVGVAFNTNGDESEGTTLVNSGYTGPPCTCCGRSNHATDNCFAKRHDDGTLLHIDGDYTNNSNETDETDQVCTQKYHHSHNHGLNFNINVSNRSSKPIPKTWILLDSQSTVDVFSNKDLLRQIHQTDTTMHIKCNAGTRSTNLQGYLTGYGWVWYYPQGIANILSLSRVKEKFRVTYDSTADNCFYIHKDHKTLQFREATRRLYYFDTANRSEESTLLVTTVADNISKFSAYDVSRAKLARSIQQRIGRPSTQAFIDIVSSNQLPNCPISAQDIKSAELIWGPDLGSLKGKQVRSCPDSVHVTTSTLPLAILEQYRAVTLSIDIMKVNNIPFLTSVSKHIKFGSAGHLENSKQDTILRHLHTIIKTYRTQGFRVATILADNQFSPLAADLANLGVAINIVSRDEHVPDIERYIRSIKDRVRSQYSVLPFKYIPPAMIIELVYSQVFWRNMFAIKGGISATMSPSEIILNRKPDFHKHCKLEFGEYVQTHEEHDNSMSARTVGAIATRPTGNVQGGYYFLRLDTGRRISRRSWTPLPMPDIVIEQVHRMARRTRASTTLRFTDSYDNDLDFDDPPHSDPPEHRLTAGVEHNTNVINDNNNDNNYYNILANHDNSDDDDSEYIPGDSDASDNDSSEGDIEYESDNDNPNEDLLDSIHLEPITNHNQNEINNHNQNNDHNTNNIAPGNTTGVDNSHITGVDNNTPPSTAPDVIDEVINDDNATTGVDNDNTITGVDNTTNTHNHPMRLRNLSRPNYKTLATKGKSYDDVTMLQFGPNNDIVETTAHEAQYALLHDTMGWGTATNSESKQNEEYMLVTEQMNWRKGIKTFKEKGEEAITQELQQIHDVDGFEPKHWHELTPDQCTSALKYLMYLKEKRDGRIKGRGCADGRPQRLYTSKEESSSPTASLAGVMMTCVIDAHEGRDVATVDIPGAFLQTRMPPEEKDVHIVLDGRMAELLAKICLKKYNEFIHDHKGKTLIYCKLNVALYGTLKAALLFWKKLTKSLTDMGFTINPYDWCVVNKIINGSQCTIVWHVDDLKISHADAGVVTNIITSLKQEYEKIGQMTVHRGKTHTYLGMTLDYSKKGCITIDMESYIDEILTELKDNPTMQGDANTPAAEHLFKVRQDVPKLDPATANLFHHIVAKLLWVTKRGRPDIQTAIAFLCTRVKSPDEDDYKKLGRIIKYLRRTKFLKLTMEANHLDQNHWFIDGAFAVHNDMKSHSGSYMSFGRGMIDGSSTKQKINTTSSTEAEVVAVHDNMSPILWIRYFLEAQGYPMKPTVIHQDNQSAMLLEKNGRGSSSKRTRHMNVRYFFVADCQERKQVIITYCPTDEMIGDFFTKPLTGIKFRRFRNIIMNCSHDDYGPVDIDALMASHYKRMGNSG